jgi:hypothetical protein
MTLATTATLPSLVQLPTISTINFASSMITSAIARFTTRIANEAMA